MARGRTSGCSPGGSSPASSSAPRGGPAIQAHHRHPRPDVPPLTRPGSSGRVRHLLDQQAEGPSPGKRGLHALRRWTQPPERRECLKGLSRSMKSRPSYGALCSSSQRRGSDTFLLSVEQQAAASAAHRAMVAPPSIVMAPTWAAGTGLEAWSDVSMRGAVPEGEGGVGVVSDAD